MAERTQNYSTDFVSRDYYAYLVNLRVKANQELVAAQTRKDLERQEDFKTAMTLLVREMRPKYLRREDIERPKILDEKRVEDMSIKELDELLMDLSRLQEALGITSMAKNEFEIDTMGAVDAEAEQE